MKSKSPRWCVPAVTLLLTASVFAQEAGSLPTVTVTADVEEDESPYVVESTEGALKTDAPLLTTPQAVDVVTEENFRERGAKRLFEVVQNTAGVSIGGVHPSFDAFKIRGYEVSWDTYLDGLREIYAPLGTNLWGLEKVEVLKGPSSALYGQSNLGGIVNKVSKRPTTDGLAGELMAGAGSWGLWEIGADVNLPIFGDAKSNGQSLTARVNAYYREGGLWYRDSTYEDLYLSGALLWKISDATSFTLLSSYRETTQTFLWGYPAEGTIFSNPNGEIDIRQYNGSVHDYNLGESDYTTIGYEFKHAFSESLSLRQNFRAAWSSFYRNGFEYPGGLDSTGRYLTVWAPYYGLQENFSVMVDTALDCQFNTGPVKHTLTGGFDYTYNAEDYSSYSNPDAEQTIDLFASGVQSDLVWSARGDLEATPRTYTNSYGFYVQDRATFLDDKLAVVIGGRYDLSTFDDGSKNYDDSAVTGRAGVSYEVAPGIAPYVSYSRSFYPQWWYTDAAGAPVEPETGEQWETGVKTEFLDKRLTANAAIFQLTRENVATSDLTTSDPWDSTVSGKQRVRGFELETAARPLPGLDLTAAYTYLDSELLEDNDRPEGIRLQGVPKHMLSGWLKYTIQSGRFKGVGAGIGSRYVGKQAGDDTASFDLPSYVVTDAALYYERENFNFQVNFNNIFDKRYFDGSYDADWIYPGAPFNVGVRASWKF
ncbi:MAG: TonB-dependent siderophore receptor [Luteolibacter sp.]